MKINSTNQTHFEGIKKMPKAELTFNEQIKEIIVKLLKRAESPDVPEYGRFRQVYETVKNTKNSGPATDFALVIKQPEGADQAYRVVNAAAYKLPTNYKYERTLASGTKEEILKAMKEEGFAQKVQETFERLSSHFE